MNRSSSFCSRCLSLNSVYVCRWGVERETQLQQRIRLLLCCGFVRGPFPAKGALLYVCTCYWSFLPTTMSALHSCTWGEPVKKMLYGMYETGTYWNNKNSNKKRRKKYIVHSMYIQIDISFVIYRAIRNHLLCFVYYILYEIYSVWYSTCKKAMRFNTCRLRPCPRERRTVRLHPTLSSGCYQAVR